VICGPEPAPWRCCIARCCIRTPKNGRKVVGGKFAALPDRAIGFELADYDRTRELIIDPTLTLLYSTYLGGKHDDEATAIALDAGGNSYILGYSASVDYPVSANAFQTELKDTGTADDGGPKRQRRAYENQPERHFAVLHLS
jgi:hypothetical protein